MTPRVRGPDPPLRPGDPAWVHADGGRHPVTINGYVPDPNGRTDRYHVTFPRGRQQLVPAYRVDRGDHRPHQGGAQ